MDITCSKSFNKLIKSKGGYNLDAIATSAVATTQTLLGDLPPQLPYKPVIKKTAMDTIHEVSLVQSKYWQTITPSSTPSLDSIGTKNIISLYEVLRKYREQILFEKYSMFSLDISNEDIKNRFQNQVFST